MNPLASARIAVRALRVNKMRSGLTMLGIVIGVGAVITMVAVGAGAQARVAEQVQSLGANLIIIWPGTVNLSGVRLGAGAQATLSEDDAWAIQSEIPLVEVAAPYARGNAQVVYTNLNWSTIIMGVTPEYFSARDWDVIEGRILTQEEGDGASKVALVGQTVARNLFGDEDPLGQTIRIKNVPFTIVGVMDRKGQTTYGQDQDDQILIPISSAKRKVLGGNLAKGRAVSTIYIKVREASMKRGGRFASSPKNTVRNDRLAITNCTCWRTTVRSLSSAPRREASTRFRSRVNASMVSREMAASISSLARKWVYSEALDMPSRAAMCSTVEAW